MTTNPFFFPACFKFLNTRKRVIFKAQCNVNVSHNIYFAGHSRPTTKKYNINMHNHNFHLK